MSDLPLGLDAAPAGGRPTAEEAFGPKPLPTAEEAFGKPQLPMRGPDMDLWFAKSGVLDGFRQGFKDAWGRQPLGLAPDTEQWMKDVGLFDDHQKGDFSLVKEFNEAVIRPAATAIDLAMRAGMGLYHGLGDVALGFGLPRDIVALPEAFPTGRTPAAVGHPVSPLPADLARARDLGVIGRGEAGWLGVSEMPPEAASREAIARLTPGGGAAELRALPPAAPEPPDIHQLARAIAPQPFAEYDALAAKKSGLLQEIERLRAEQPQIQEVQQRIDDILGKVGGVEERLTKAAADRLEAARDALHELATTDSPEMARLRQEVMQADYRQRDLAPEVSAAYRQAA